MNEFSAKKLGEVLAFTEVERETFEKSKTFFESVLGISRVAEIIEVSAKHQDAIHALADRAKVLGSVASMLETTNEKLRQMRDLYLGEEQHDPTELLEWSGFFEGAAIIHASLLTGVAEEIGHSELYAFAESFLHFHKDIFTEVEELLHLAGRHKAGA